MRVRLPAAKREAKLRPLAIAFRSESIVLPVKLMAGEAPFSLGATIFATRRL